jgi:hypothetical protein
MSNLSDVINGSDLYGATNYMFTYDRWYQLNSAIYFNKTSSYFSTPQSNYITGDFTLILWIKLLSNQTNNTIIRFSNSTIDTVRLYTDTTSNSLRARINPGTLNTPIDVGQIDFNTWLHIALGIKNTSAYLYLNGQLKYNGTLLQPYNSITYGQIGPYDGIVDEIKLYNGSLNSTDILNDYYYNLPSKYFKKFNLLLLFLIKT